MVGRLEQGALGLVGGGVAVATILAQERLGAPPRLGVEVWGDSHVRRGAGDGVFGGAGLTPRRPMLRCAPHRAVSWQGSRLSG
jgi:hypothetical protein